MTGPHTVADLMLQTADTCLHELVRGTILLLPLPKGEHGVIEARLVAIYRRYLYRAAEVLGWDESRGMDARDLLVRLVSALVSPTIRTKCAG